MQKRISNETTTPDQEEGTVQPYHDGEIDVAETEEAKSGWTKSSIDYMVMDDDSGDKAGATVAMEFHPGRGLMAGKSMDPTADEQGHR